MILFKALLPITSFILLYFAIAIGLNDFYAVPILPLLLVSTGLSLTLFRKIGTEKKLNAFAKGAGNELIITMVLIFLLSGIFSQLGTETGALKTLIIWMQSAIPPSLFLVGIFLFACLLSMTIGTSVGTIVALAPLVSQTPFSSESDVYLLLGAIVGGAMFGDNLSFISDTTIAVTKTHGIEIRDKFKANIRLVLPAAVITSLIYILNPLSPFELDTREIPAINWASVLLICPYLIVLILAFSGLNLLLVLSIGILGFLLVGFTVSNLSFAELLNASNAGVLSLTELSIIAMLLGGLSGLVQLFGGFDIILKKLKRNSHTPRTAGLNIIGLSALLNTLLANNTLSIIIAGPLAKDIAQHNQIPFTKSASIVDTITCAIQGILPYGAQLLLAVALSGKNVSSFALVPYVIYPILIGISTLVFVLLTYNWQKSRAEKSQN